MLAFALRNDSILYRTLLAYMYKVACLLCLCLISLSLKGQVLSEDFETGNLDRWSILGGNAEITDQVASQGQRSVRLFSGDSDGEHSLLLRRNFSVNYATFDVQCRADGPSSDIFFLFQYLDGQNYYAVACNPNGTDNPYILLYKVVNGLHTTLDSVPPVFSRDEWFKLTVERRCDGSINVLINDNAVMTARDQTFTEEGSLVLGAFDESTYFDDLQVETFRCEEIVEIFDTICSGEGYSFGDTILTEGGIYDDTLQNSIHWDSIIRLELTHGLHYLVTEPDTICQGESYIFGADTLLTTGRYRKTFYSSLGCDSIVEVILTVLGTDTTMIDTSICASGSYVFGQDTLTETGSYLRTLTSASGCDSIIALNLTMFEEDSIVRDTVLCPGEFLMFYGDTITGEGTFYTTITNEQCSTTIVQHVSVNQIEVDLGPDQEMCFEDAPGFQISIPHFDEILWSDGSIDSSLFIPGPGLYFVEVSDGICTDRDTIRFTENCAETNSIYIPNAFSPNGDNVNDQFMPVFTERPLEYSMQIANRWGSIIFQTQSPERGWDGMVNGELANPGVYLYVVQIDGKLRSGTVSVIN